ncbi:TraM recognition domain-containing protein [Vibrio parahaemolyticus]|nr:TraM recognition domain-containing protein [Vibrio parahaemolyticus]EIA9325431.1 TraM recognition domain-containing protein [Vibrio parahaemolyticus]EJG1681353.1 TraM recognition domain-containing protein [Vibrio parahaemolyticus]
MDKAELQRRPLTLDEKLGLFFNSNNVLVLFPASLIIYLIQPFFFLIFGLVSFALIKRREVKVPKMPFFLPASSGINYDPFNPSPAKKQDGSKSYRGAKGIVYFGNEVENNLQCWFDNGTVKQHCSFLAATGSGKTFTMIGIFNVNSLIFGAGYILIDGKADLDLAHKEISLLHRFNRLDDLFLINYIQGDSNPWDEYEGHISTNTFNILDTGTAASCIESFKSLLAGDGDIWAKRADALVAGLLGPLVFLRDERVQFLNMGTLIDYLTVESAGLLASPEPLEQFNNVKIPEQVNKQIYGFIKTLPGVSAGDFKTLLKGESVKSTQVYDQFGFCSMQIILVCNMLAGDYTKIFGCESGDINQDAIVLTDRVLLALLPALEASPQSVASMGRIVLSSRKAMMGRSLGHQIEGEAKRNIETRPTNSSYPYINVMDEVGMYFDLSEGPASAQSRSLGFCLAYLAQDLPAMGKLSEEVSKTVKTVMANTIIKIGGRIIDEETRDYYQKLAGKHFVWQRDRAEISAVGMSTKSKDSSASYVEEDRLDNHEIQKLREGELYITAIDELHRVDGPTMVPKNMKQLALNQFVPWQPYDVSFITNYKLAKLEMKEIFHRATTTEIEMEFDTDSVSLITDILERVEICKNNTSSLTEAFAYGFASYATMQSDLLSSINGLYDALEDDLSEHDVSAEPLSYEEPESTTETETQQPANQEKTNSSENNAQEAEHVNEVASSTNEEPQASSSVESEEPQHFEKPSEEEINAYLSDDDDREDSLSQDPAIGLDDDVGFNKEEAIEITKSDIDEVKREKYASLLNISLENNGTSREEISQSMTELAVRTNKLERIDMDLRNGTITKDEATKLQNSPVTEDEVQVASEHVDQMLSHVESSVVHPRLPSPTTNVERTVNILSEIHSILESNQ